MNFVNGLLDWLATLPAEFAFLLALPFVVAIAGLLADRPARRKPAAVAPVPAAPRPAHAPIATD
jgi:hypothetical protein